MIVFVYLISDDLQDIYVYICFLFFFLKSCGPWEQSNPWNLSRSGPGEG